MQTMQDDLHISASLPAAPSSSASTNTVHLRALRRWWVRPRTRDLFIALLYCSPALLVFGLFTYLPFFRAVFLSLNVTNQAGQAVAFNGLAYYLRILNLDGSGRTEYLNSIGTSFGFMLMVVPPVTVISLGLALLSTVKVRGIQIFRTIFTGSIAISLASAGVIWSLLYNPATKATAWLVDLLQIPTPSLLGYGPAAIPAVAAMTVWSGIGFNFILALAGIQAIPHDLYETASIDGAGRWARFRHITLPLLSPTLLFLVIIGSIGSLQAFTQFHLLMPDAPNTVFVYLTYRAFWYDNRYGLAAAMSIVLFAILVALTILQYRTLDRRVHYH
ncbi:MAG: sugar ABC transporter permease [Anaerolineae bacterium]|nr:sugar ABC transporter permease [Anaerolineae bacterium]